MACRRVTVTSFGIICTTRFGHGELQCLMVQRKDTIAFVEFVTGQFESTITRTLAL
jgi:hypothetical protein